MSWSRSRVYVDYNINACFQNIRRQHARMLWIMHGTCQCVMYASWRVFNSRCHNFLLRSDVKWRQQRSEKILKLKKIYQTEIHASMWFQKQIITLCVDYPGWYVRTVVQLNTYVLRGSATTHLTRGGNFYSIFFCSLSQNARMKLFVDGRTYVGRTDRHRGRLY